jgi:hypothetical protein
MSIITISTIFFAVMLSSLVLVGTALIQMFMMRNDNTYPDDFVIITHNEKGRE